MQSHCNKNVSLYQVISHQHNLGAAILKAMQKLSKGESPYYLVKFQNCQSCRQLSFALKRHGILILHGRCVNVKPLVLRQFNMAPGLIALSLKCGSSILTSFICLSCAGSSGHAVYIRKIIDVIHSSHAFCHVTYQQVQQSLDKLLESSDVYKQSRYEYCLV